MIWYQRTPKGRSNHKKQNKRYRQSFKGKVAEARYRRTKKRKAVLKRYNGSDKRKSVQLKYDYGITLEEYEQILNEQNGKCLLCGNEPKNRALTVDHDHSTGEIRGLLCGTCNTGLGSFQDDPELLRKAADYLIDWKVRKWITK